MRCLRLKFLIRMLCYFLLARHEQIAVFEAVRISLIFIFTSCVFIEKGKVVKVCWMVLVALTWLLGLWLVQEWQSWAAYVCLIPITILNLTFDLATMLLLGWFDQVGLLAEKLVAFVPSWFANNYRSCVTILNYEKRLLDIPILFLIVRLSTLLTDKFSEWLQNRNFLVFLQRIFVYTILRWSLFLPLRWSQ
jgi:hypothetical protein